MTDSKPFEISRFAFAQAFEEVKANKGSAGIDGVSIEAYESNLEDNLYRLWNRMSSGSYFPKPVKQVLIPKKNGKLRPLGIPTVEDRVAQSVAKNYVEPVVESIFLDESYGYRPNKSALDAIGATRKRCWQYDWVIEFDIVGLFDNISHELLYKAFDKHFSEKWLRLYVRRWSQTPIQQKDGVLVDREAGVSQGGVMSPLLANLFLHYVFDLWMKREFQKCPFERYADDAVIHCTTLEEAKRLLEKLDTRMRECRLELHPEKTKIVYCRDSKRRQEHENNSFDFLGYTFRPRSSMTKDGKRFTGFLPAVSKSAEKRLKDKLRDFRLYRKSESPIKGIAEIVNPIIRGWMGYFGAFYPSQMRKTLRFIDLIVVRWAQRKFKRFKYKKKRAIKWLKELAGRYPAMFYHWSRGYVL
jgi:RNA-directed DNA polymerase